VKPLYKWVGGKTNLLPEILPRVPKEFKGYHEPFFGGGAVFMALRDAGRMPKHSRISDANPDLIATVKMAKEDPGRLLGSLKALERAYHTQDPENLYYRIREAWNEGHHTPARFIFLKQTAFNGLWRLNRKGEMNASWGKFKNPKFYDANNVLAVGNGLQNILIRDDKWEDAVKWVHYGDFVYFDPPYLGTFTGYTGEGFDETQQVKLMQWCAKSVAKILYSNEASPELYALLKEHWPDAIIEEVSAKRSISTNGAGRQNKMEVLVRNYEL
jgi:DNA adenine methylase